MDPCITSQWSGSGEMEVHELLRACCDLTWFVFWCCLTFVSCCACMLDRSCGTTAWAHSLIVLMSMRVQSVECTSTSPSRCLSPVGTTTRSRWVLMRAACCLISGRCKSMLPSSPLCTQTSSRPEAQIKQASCIRNVNHFNRCWTHQTQHQLSSALLSSAL